MFAYLLEAWDFLDGKKVYIIAGLTAVYAILGLIVGRLDFDTFVRLMSEAGFAGGLRHAVAKSSNNE
jgi:hypothetical protein